MATARTATNVAIAPPAVTPVPVHPAPVHRAVMASPLSGEPRVAMAHLRVMEHLAVTVRLPAAEPRAAMASPLSGEPRVAMAHLRVMEHLAAMVLLPVVAPRAATVHRPVVALRIATGLKVATVARPGVLPSAGADPRSAGETATAPLVHPSGSASRGRSSPMT
ncbi:hypothetical protein [Microbacterium sp. P05]|uniref:hypothetical protein n=1 Tax=Microbacterium sp. P05 TaxID=3366948 RepID=UPI003745BFEF